ncbi:MAG: hypothetical protein ACRYFX_18355 [Janthinobacterium lividum]
MFGSQILEVGLGVVLVFILTSIMCSVIREGLDAWLKTRAAFLEYGIRELLHDREGTKLAAAFFNHPLIYSLFAGEYTPGSTTSRPSAFTKGGTLPSYIPTRNFALALLDMAARGPVTDVNSSTDQAPGISLESIRANVGNLQNPAVQRVVLTALDSAQGDLNKVQSYLQDWYNSSMDQISGWYKSSSQWVIFWVALVVAITLNINTITITDYLSHNDVARAALVARAQATVKNSGAVTADYYQAKSALDSLALPIGWSNGWGAPRQHVRAAAQGFEYWNDLLAPVAGWLITALAAMLGAPFWFDVLNKIMIIRSTVKPHEKSPEEASDDRQLPPAQPGPPATPAGSLPGPETLSYSTPATATLPADAHSDLDGCDVVAVNLTPDEDLPAAEGGVA